MADKHSHKGPAGSECPECGKKIPHDSNICPECGLTLPMTDATLISGRPPAGDSASTLAGDSSSTLAGDSGSTLPGDSPGGAGERAMTAGAVLGGRYEILDVIGKGGMGWVYKAKDREIDRVVALKVIRQELAGDETIIKRFKDEIILARKVTHKNVLRIYDIAEAEGVKFMSMPFIEGKDLKTIITEQGPLDIDETVRIASQVLEALKSAHDAGVIHRDLKPQNIMIDQEGTVCVADFGIAKSADAGGMTVTGQIIGTPEYMSPEQAEGKEVDYRTDLYSFGLVLYEMLTGDVPFKADSIISTLMLRLREPPRPPSTVRAEVPQWLDRMTMKSIERNVEDRYATADEILADIETQTVKIRRKVRPRTLAIIAVAVVAAAVVAFFAILKPRVVLEEKRTYLAVLPFENMTGDENLDWLALGIPDNLTADLGQSKFFRVMSFERLRHAAADIGADFTELGTPEAMGMLAKATDLDAVATGSYFKAGDDIRITMKVQNPNDQELIGSKIVQDTEDGILNLIDQLTRETKLIFNLSQEEIDEDLDRAVGLQRTRSVTAASYFTKGQELTYAGSPLEAAQAFEAAIAADENFAMAYAKASEAYKTLGYDEKAESLSLIAVDKVVKLIDRVPAVDRTFILANHGAVTYNAEYAIESYKDFIETYPDDPEGYYKLGMTYDTISEWDLAIENLREALKLDPKFGSARFELGKVLIRKNDLEAALVELGRAAEFYAAIGNREGEAAVLNAMGVVHKRRNEFEEAISYYQSSIDLKEELGDRRGVAASLGNLGLLYKLMGKRDEALDVLERSLEIRKEIGDKVGTSTALNKIGQIYQNYGRYDEALSYFERSYETREEIGAKDLVASSLSDRGYVYSIMGNYDKAFEMDSMALAIRTEIGDVRGESESLRNIAETLMARGRFEDAAARLRRALSLDNSLSDTRLLANDDLALGAHCLARGKADSAIAYLSSAIEVLVSLDNAPTTGVAMSILGEAYLLKDDYTRALANLDQALETAGIINQEDLAVDAALGKGLLFHEIGYQPGCDSILAILDRYDESTMPFQARCRLTLSRACRTCARGQVAETEELVGRLVEVTGTDYVRCRVQGSLVVARATADTGTPGEAEQTLNGVIAEARRYSLRDIECEALWLLAGVLTRQGRVDDAMESCDKALEIAAALGLAEYESLVACGDVRMKAGDAAGAAGFFTRALDEAATVYEDKCPPRLRSYYVEQKRIPHYLSLLDNLPSETEGTPPPRNYGRIFGLN
ncbi:MAG: tetratricopeptide repeat protein [Candidatus Eisenbacteria bacterium]